VERRVDECRWCREGKLPQPGCLLPQNLHDEKITGKVRFLSPQGVTPFLPSNSHFETILRRFSDLQIYYELSTPLTARVSMS